MAAIALLRHCGTLLTDVCSHGRLPHATVLHVNPLNVQCELDWSLLPSAMNELCVDSVVDHWVSQYSDGPHAVGRAAGK